MRIFIYEYVTGGGWFEVEAAPPSGSLLREGTAMLHAVASDFLTIPDIEVAVLHDTRLKLEPPASKGCLQTVASRTEADGKFLEQAAISDFTLVIAPEVQGRLLGRSSEVERLGKVLLSPNRVFIGTARDKWLCWDQLSEAGVAVPRTWPDDHLPSDVPYPLVIKPRIGCGSRGVQLLRSADQAVDWTEFPDDEVIEQEFCPGLPASVALLCGPANNHSLPACRQTLSNDNRFRYLGGECPLPKHMNLRAQLLAKRAIEALPPTIGYVGVDLILGEAEDGSQDYVIEINPRLTTSYVGLRALSNTNLAQAMLDVAQGREPQLDWKPGRVTWTADGKVQYFEK